MIRRSDHVVQMQGFHNLSLSFLFFGINFPLFPLPAISHLLINNLKKKTFESLEISWWIVVDLGQVTFVISLWVWKRVLNSLLVDNGLAESLPMAFHGEQHWLSSKIKSLNFFMNISFFLGINSFLCPIVWRKKRIFFCALSTFGNTMKFYQILVWIELFDFLGGFMSQLWFIIWILIERKTQR